jgi:hypothetical protein
MMEEGVRLSLGKTKQERNSSNEDVGIDYHKLYSVVCAADFA